ncbi:MAG: DUF6491 family protein [Sphingomicrobium sp.]
MMKTSICSFALLVIAASPAAASGRIPAAGIAVPAAPISRIHNWYASNPTTLYLQSRTRTWYKAEMARPCWEMPEAARIKVDMTDGKLDNSSTVRFHGERCQVASVYRVPGPLRPLLVKGY